MTDYGNTFQFFTQRMDWYSAFGLPSTPALLKFWFIIKPVADVLSPEVSVVE